MPLMGSLYIGSSGLQTSQNALNTTAHNLSNVDTVGYTRQQVQQSGKSYITISVDPKSVANKEYGLGVSYASVKHVRDYFLDKTFRRESGRSMFYEVSTEVMEEVESQLGELNGEAFQTTISDFWTSIQELTKDPCSSVAQGLMVQRASELVERSVAIYEGLSSYQNNLNVQIKQQVDKINEYGNQLLVLNDKIRAIEVGGVENANDLRDTRDMILDELAELTNMTCEEDMYGNVSVKIEGVDFVKGGTCYEIGMKVDETTGFYTPYWPQNASYKVLDDGSKVYNIDGAEVFDLSIEISSDLGTDVGGLKSMLLARGDHRADYSDAKSGNYDKVSQSVIMNIQAEFDQLIHGVATAINDILATAAGVKEGALTNVTLADGTKLSDAEMANVRYASADDGNTYLRSEHGYPLQLFSKITTSGYQKVTATDADGNTGEYWVYKEENMEQPDTMYTLKNLEVNPELMQNPSRLGFRLKDGSEDNVTVEALKEAFSAQEHTLNPNVQKKTNFLGYYDDMVSQVANSGYVYRSIYENQVTTVEATKSARDQIVGVSSDEELANMVRFQNAYNASSRYINVVNQMLEHILNTLGV